MLLGAGPGWRCLQLKLRNNSVSSFRKILQRNQIPCTSASKGRTATVLAKRGEMYLVMGCKEGVGQGGPLLLGTRQQKLCSEGHLGKSLISEDFGRAWVLLSLSFQPD